MLAFQAHNEKHDALPLWIPVWHVPSMIKKNLPTFWFSPHTSVMSTQHDEKCYPLFDSLHTPVSWVPNMMKSVTHFLILSTHQCHEYLTWWKMLPTFSSDTLIWRFSLNPPVFHSVVIHFVGQTWQPLSGLLEHITDALIGSSCSGDWQPATAKRVFTNLLSAIVQLQ